MTVENKTAVPRPHWALLDRFGHRDDHANTNTGTAASSLTSTGKEIFASLRVAAPPATSRVYLRWSSGPKNTDKSFVYPRIVAAHADAILFHLISSSPPNRPAAIDYFVYRVIGAAREPSMSLLKPYASTPFSPRQRMIYWKAIGILHHGENAYVVAELSTTGDSPAVLEHCMIRSPPTPYDKWKVRRVEAVDAKGRRNPELPCWDLGERVRLRG